MESILFIKVANNVEVELNKIDIKFALFLLNIDSVISTSLFHQKPDLLDKNNFK